MLNTPASATLAGPITLISLSDVAIEPQELNPIRANLLGRQSQCDVQLADQTVSRVHALVEQKAGVWYVTDKSSRLGSMLNGVRLEAERPTLMRDGDVLSIARWSFKVHAGPKASVRGHAAMTIVGSSKLSEAEQGKVETFRSEALLSQAEKRLHSVMDLAASLQAATSEADLGRAVVKAAAEGSPFERIAFIKPIPGTDVVTTLAARVNGVDAPMGFPFSRSLVRAASGGEVAKLTGGDSVLRHALSIVAQDIRNGVCAPVMTDGNAAAFLYADVSGQFGAPPQQHSPEVDAYVAAIAKIASLSLSELQRKQLRERHTALESDLAAARVAQEKLMPPARGRVSGVVYAALNKPGRLVAGDLVDIIDLGNGRVAAFLGDVSGKGVGAAMLMAAAQTQLRASLGHEPDLAKAVAHLNRDVVTRLASDGFISLWVGVFDANTRQLSYVDCGHSYWVHRSGNGVTEGPTPHCMLLGVDVNETYDATTITLEPGARVTVYSDGVAEQLSPAGQQFKPSGVTGALGPCADVEMDVSTLMDALKAHAAGDTFSDDVTILSMTLV
jgi:serine phosphatase RsbU (regulator of sigma subunit)